MLFDTDVLIFVQRGNKKAAKLIEETNQRRIIRFNIKATKTEAAIRCSIQVEATVKPIGCKGHQTKR